MQPTQKRTVKEFEEGLYRKHPLPILPKDRDSHRFTFSKMGTHMRHYTKSPLASFGQENIDTSNTKDRWFADKYKGFEFTFNGYLSKKKAI